MSQFSLLKKKKFGPFFWTQFLGAFNDNLFKNALLIMFAFQGTTQLAGGMSQMDASTLVNLSAGLFILPFFLFSALAGQLADKFDKGKLIRLIKLFEIILMSIAAFGFIFDTPVLLLSLLFLMGTQSAFFGPVKYSILPQHLEEEELVGGNGMVEMGTFLAILLGTVAGGVLIALEQGRAWVACGIVLLAVIGWLKSRGIPEAIANAPDLKIAFNPITETWRVIQFTRENIVVFRSILGISWFWFYGAIFLAQMPTFTEKVIHGNELVVTILLTVFSLGIGTGSLLCERLSNKKIELGLVPFGAIGLTLFALDLWWVSIGLPDRELIGVGVFLQELKHWHLMVDLLLIGLFGGFYIVPLYALIQQRSKPENRSRIIAGNNILNALFMVVAAALAIVTLGQGYTIPQLFLFVAILNALVAIYIFTLVPEFLLRFLVWIMVHFMYRIRLTGKENLPEEGGAILVSNHVSFIDFALITGVCPRPVRFIMDVKIFKAPLLNFFFRAGKSIPITGAGKHPGVLKAAFESVRETLSEGDLVGVFPEGRITKTGSLNSFHKGIERMVKDTPVPVIPIALKGVWGSFFSKKDGAAMQKLPRRFWSQIVIEIHPPIQPENVTVEHVQSVIEGMLKKG